MDSDLFDSPLIEFFDKAGYEVHCSPKDSCKYGHSNKYQISILVENEDTFRLELLTIGILNPDYTFLSLSALAKNGEVMKQSGGMNRKEKRIAIDIFNIHIIELFNEFIDEKNFTEIRINCEKQYFFWE